jgi:phage-related minor tail protein
MSLLERVGQTAVGRLGSAFEGFFSGQKQNMKEFAASFIADIGRMIAKAALLKAVSGIGGPAGGFLSTALGGTTAFANGGVLTNPMQFPMAGGRGVAGESGPEAILPLKRGKNGKLGVAGAGGGGNTAVVNNNITFHASGNEQTDRNSIQQIRMAVDMAVKRQLAEQRYNTNRGY